MTQGDGELDDASVTSSRQRSTSVSLRAPRSRPEIPRRSARSGYAEISDSKAGFRGLDANGDLIWTGGDATITQNDTAASNPGNSALIDTVDAGGDIYITQGNGDSDTATISDSKAGLAGFGEICITQGDGKGDSATIDQSTAADDVTITQGNGAGDTAWSTRSPWRQHLRDPGRWRWRYGHGPGLDRGGRRQCHPGRWQWRHRQHPWRAGRLGRQLGWIPARYRRQRVCHPG